MRNTSHVITVRLGKATRCAGANPKHNPFDKASGIKERYEFWNGDILVIYKDGNGAMFSGINQTHRDNLIKADIVRIETNAQFDKRVQPEIKRLNQLLEELSVNGCQSVKL